MVSPVGGGWPSSPFHENAKAPNKQWIQEINDILVERQFNRGQGLADLEKLISQIQDSGKHSQNIMEALSYLGLAKEQWSSAPPNVVSAYLTSALSSLESDRST